ncbi:PREDICTED: melatonin receptor type 1C-like [Eurypyga helias]|uniref:melatonin receptor type 1C-like n=1 Tax=Eurypyga helias TaxID=54383 RepID=UPI00052826DF|nr:PREDICTED: melatonin receptor type 1C-like [Eurypyga helias]
MGRSAMSSIIAKPPEECAESADQEAQTMKWSKDNSCIPVKDHAKVHSAAVAAPGAKASSQTLQNQLVRFLWKRSSAALRTDTGCKDGCVDSPGMDHDRNIFVVSLSVADLVVAVYPYPLILSAIFHNGWTMGNVHCQISGFLMGLSVIGSIFNITAIAINRYCYICHSLRYDKLFNLKNTCCYLCLTWTLTVVAIVPNFFVGSLQYDPRIYSCTFAQTVSTSYTITVVVVHFIVPLSIVTFCYLRIWILVIQVKHRVRQDCKQKLRAADIRNFLTMFVVFVLFAVCWGPLNFIGLAVSINPSKVQPHIPEWLFILSYFMAYFNSCLNAVIYGLLNQNFRKEYKRILLTLRTPRLLFIDVSKGGTEGMKSKPSPAVTNNNNQAEIHL